MSWKLKTTALALMTLTAACGAGPQATRGLPFAEPGGAAALMAAPDYDVTAVEVGFAPGMRVSEANRYYPIADIVWRGDPYGDRFEQISTMAHSAMDPATQAFDGARPVVVDVTFTRFHSLTEKTRYSVGGTHSIHFDLTVRDAQTGAIIDGPRAVDASFPGLGGTAALAAEHRGETQKARVTARLSQVITQELSRPVRLASAE